MVESRAKSCAGSSKSLKFDRHLKAPVGEVWNAWVDREAFARWLGPASIIRCDAVAMNVVANGMFRICMFTSTGEAHVVSGRYLEVVPCERLRFSWSWEGEQRGDTVVTVDLAKEGRGTRLTVTHTGFADREARFAHEGGWEGSLSKLESLLQGPHR